MKIIQVLKTDKEILFKDKSGVYYPFPLYEGMRPFSASDFALKVPYCSAVEVGGFVDDVKLSDCRDVTNEYDHIVRV